MEQGSKNVSRLIISFGSIIIVLLLVTIGSLLLFWKPWDVAINANTRRITITGQASTKAEPDQFVFSPSYSKDTTDQATKLNDEIVAKLKSLGVTDAQIKNNASRYGSPELYYKVPVTGGKQQTTLSLTITLNDKKLAQKVQDYLVTTNPDGTITPYPSFSTDKRKELENKVRDQAIADARQKADKTASGLGAKIGKVISVSEGSGGGVYPNAMDSAAGSEGGASVAPSTTDKSLGVQPGSDEFNYSVTVVFVLD
jgi:uncharacterized protein YggE